MKSILKALTNVLKRGGFAFIYYPMSMIFAICLTVLSIWIILAQPQTNLKLIYSLEWTFAFGAFFNMACCAIAKKTSENRQTFIIANVVAAFVSVAVFLAAFLIGGDNISTNSIMRVVAGITISFLVFVIVPTYKSTKIHYNEMVFMTLKSFFVSIVYSLVIMLGFFFVAFAVQSLLYSDLSGKIYSYIAILSGLFGYAFFLGYFPEFKMTEGIDDEKINKAIKQPRFAEILFQNILIPIIGALTLVLFIWCIRILITKEWPDYNQIIAIFTTYSLGSLFIYYLVSSYETTIAKLYKRVIPIAILIFLAFEAYRIVSQINLYGVKPFEYMIVFVWLFAASSSFLFLFLPVIKNRIPSYIAIALIAIIVMPGIGAPDASYFFQTKRLESILTRNAMLIDGKVVSGTAVSSKDKKDITDATIYLYQQENKKAPTWLLSDMPSLGEFKKVYGFDQEFYDPGRNPVTNSTSITLRPESKPISIEGYSYYIPRDISQTSIGTTISTSKGNYQLLFVGNIADMKGGTTTPSIIVKKDGNTILDKNLSEFASGLKSKYPADTSSNPKGDRIVPFNELSVKFEGTGVSIELIFQVVTFSSDGQGNNTEYFELQGILFKES